MAWAKRTKNGMGRNWETVTQASSATYAYSSVIDFLKPKGDGKARYISIFGEASAVTGTNIDISLWGAYTSGGTKFLLLDAPIADLTNAAKTAGGSINIEAYPAPYYFIGMLADADEHLNKVTLSITPEVI